MGRGTRMTSAGQDDGGTNWRDNAQLMNGQSSTTPRKSMVMASQVQASRVRTKTQPYPSLSMPLTETVNYRMTEDESEELARIQTAREFCCASCNNVLQAPPGRRIPKSLNCLHVLCQSCLEIFERLKGRQGTLDCPLCHSNTEIPQVTIVNLQEIVSCLA